MGAASYLEDIEERRDELRRLISHEAESIGSQQAQSLGRVLELADRAALQLQDLLTQPNMDWAIKVGELQNENRKLVEHNNELAVGNERVAGELKLARREIDTLRKALSEIKERRLDELATAGQTIRKLENLSVLRLFGGNARVRGK